MNNAELVAREPTEASMTREEIMLARNPSKRTHPAGRPVSRSTYVNHGCRCDGCTDANATYSSERAGRAPRPRQHRAVLKLRNAERQSRENQAIYRARARLARIHAEEYRTLLVLARTEIDIERGSLPGDPS